VLSGGGARGGRDGSGGVAVGVAGGGVFDIHLAIIGSQSMEFWLLVFVVWFVFVFFVLVE